MRSMPKAVEVVRLARWGKNHLARKRKGRTLCQLRLDADLPVEKEMGLCVDCRRAWQKEKAPDLAARISMGQEWSWDEFRMEGAADVSE